MKWPLVTNVKMKWIYSNIYQPNFLTFKGNRKYLDRPELEYHNLTEFKLAMRNIKYWS